MGAPVTSLMATARCVAISSATIGRLSAKFCPFSLLRPSAIIRSSVVAMMLASSQCSIVSTPAVPAEPDEVHEGAGVEIKGRPHQEDLEVEALFAKHGQIRRRELVGSLTV